MVDNAGRLTAIKEFRRELQKLDVALQQYETAVNAGWNVDTAFGQTAAIQGWMKSAMETYYRLLNLSMSNEDFFRAKKELWDFMNMLPQYSFPHVVVHKYQGEWFPPKR